VYQPAEVEIIWTVPRTNALLAILRARLALVQAVALAAVRAPTATLSIVLAIVC
jgi:hypothetical protein